MSCRRLAAIAAFGLAEPGMISQTNKRARNGLRARSRSPKPVVRPRPPPAGCWRRRRSACLRAGRTAVAADAPPRPGSSRCRAGGIGRAGRRAPRRRPSTPGLQRADLVRHADHRRGVGGHHRHHLLQRQAERQHRAHRLRQAELRLAGKRMRLVVGMLRRRAGRRRHIGVVAMHVGAERVGHDAGVERLAGEAIGEVAAVADIDLEPAVERGLDHLVHLAFAVDEAAGMARERMRQNIAGPQLWDHALEDRVGILAVGAAPAAGPRAGRSGHRAAGWSCGRSRRTSAAP